MERLAQQSPVTEHEPLEAPDELLIIANPVSANAIRGKRLITEILQAHPNATVEVYPTSPDGRQINQQRLLDLLQERVDPNNPDRKNLWIVLATGDGTIRDVAEAMQHADDAIRNVPILPLAAGNGNDFTSMAHSFKGKYAPGLLLNKAHLQPIYPLRCELKHDADVENLLAVGYISVGAIAQAARRIDKDRGHHKLSRLIREKAIAVKSLMESDHFEIEEDGAQHVLFDRIFANGNRMAKYFRLPGRLEHDKFHDITISSGSFGSLAVNAGRLACGLLKGRAIERTEPVSFTTKTPTMIQLDGEAFDIKPDTTVTISTAEHPLNVVRLV